MLNVIAAEAFILSKQAIFRTTESILLPQDCRSKVQGKLAVPMGGLISSNTPCEVPQSLHFGHPLHMEEMVVLKVSIRFEATIIHDQVQ